MAISSGRLPVIVALLILLPSLLAVPGPAAVQADSVTFPETGKTVKGLFLEYWTAHGGLAQQGYPISGEEQEKSETDGHVYAVQYFERAVFEWHPENHAENGDTSHEVLLSLLGNFRYKQKYGDGAPNQQPNNDPGSRLFTETGKRAGGAFLDYWLRNGGLPQQGLPISDEFVEVSDLDGKPYKVQYFERAVFEYHPGNRPPYDVLLSHLGTFRYEAKLASVPKPNGRLAFASRRDGNWEIYLVDANGSNLRRLTNDPAHDRYPSASPDGKQIAFYSERDGGAKIYVMNVDGSNQHPLTNGQAEDVEPAWSPDGKYIAFSSQRGGVGSIYVMNADGSNIRKVTKGESGGDAIPTWSPDSKRIAFMASVIVGQKPGNTLLNEDIHVINVDGTNERKLTDTPGVDGLPAWSRDNRIAFASDRDGNPEIYVMDSDGSNVRRVAPGQDGAHPAWSPDSKYIAFVTEITRNNPDIMVMAADGSNIWRLTDNPAADWLPAWLPVSSAP
jgi:TolB protein